MSRFRLDHILPYSEKFCIQKMTIQNTCGRYIYIKTTLYGIRYLLLDYNESVLTVLGKAS